jgi:hypothetical protein
MKVSLALKSVIVLAVTTVFVGALSACGLDTPGPFKLPADVRARSVSDSHFVAVTASGRLIDGNLWGGGTRDLGTLGQKLLPVVAAHGDKALVASEGQAHLVDLKKGKIERSVPFAGKRPHGLGFLDAHRAFVHADSSVSIVDVRTGKALHKVELPGRFRMDWMGWHYRSANGRLYVAGEALYVIDPQQGKLVETIRARGNWIGGLHVTHKEAFVVEQAVGCGWMTLGVTRIDLATKKRAPLALPEGGRRVHGLVSDHSGHFFLSGGNRTFRYDRDGKLQGEVKGAQGQLVGAWLGHAAVLSGTTLTFVPPWAMGPTTARAR